MNSQPQNVFLAQHEQGEEVVEIPKIVDFGISKIRHLRPDDLKTQTKEVLGTPYYMSPEQACGDNDLVDARTDQWALATIVYECLTGQRAFGGDSLPSILYQVCKGEPPSLRMLAPDVPAYAEQVILKALSKKREQRFCSVQEFVRALDGQLAIGNGSTAAAASGAHELASSVATSRRMPRLFWALWAAAPLLGAGGVTVYLKWPHGTLPEGGIHVPALAAPLQPEAAAETGVSDGGALDTLPPSAVPIPMVVKAANKSKVQREPPRARKPRPKPDETLDIDLSGIR